MSLQQNSETPLAVRLPLEHHQRSGQALALRFVPGYFVMILVGLLVFKFGGVMETGNELSWSRVTFTTLNAATLTGFPQDVQTDPEETRGPAMLLALMLSAIVLNLIVGGLAVVRILRLPYTDRQVIYAAFVTTLIAVLAGTLGVFSRDRTLFEAVFLAVSAFGNCGLTAGSLGGVENWEVHAILLPLAVIGGMGLPVLMELFDRATGLKQLSTHTRVVVLTTAVLYLAATLVFVLLQRPGAAAAAGRAADWREALVSSSSVAVNARGAGFPLEFAGGFPRTMQWVLVVLMFVGANPAGTAGGVKATTLVQLVRGIRSALHGGTVPRAFGIAAAWFGAYSGLVLIGFLLMVWRVPDLPVDRLLFLTTSAAGNIGLAHDPIAITGPGLYTLSAIMLAGRLLPLAVLWWMARTTTDADVAVG